MKKSLLLLFGIACAMSMHARVIYLKIGNESLWNPSKSVFFCKSWGGGAVEQEIEMTKVAEFAYSAEIDDAHTGICFVQMPKKASSIDKKKVLNKTAEMMLFPDFDTYIITGFGEEGGIWAQTDVTVQYEIKSNLPLEYSPEKITPQDAR